MFRRGTQQKLMEDASGQEDNSTQISNNIDPSLRNMMDGNHHDVRNQMDKRKLGHMRLPKWYS